MKRLLLFAFISVAACAWAAESDSAAPQVVLSGIPILKVEENGIGRSVTKLAPKEAAALRCSVGKDGSRYVWISREGRDLQRSASGVFETFSTKDGSNYVRVLRAPNKEAFAPKTPERQFDYVEHVVVGLSSVTYYGVISPR